MGKVNKFKIAVILLLFPLFSASSIAKCPDNTEQKFTEIQRALAGDPSMWNFRGVTKKTDFFYPVPIGPESVLDIEESARMEPDSSVETKPDNEDDQSFIKLGKLYFDEDSKKGAFLRASAGGTQFSGNYKLTSDKTTELEIIKDIYEQITSRIARYGIPTDDSPANCLKENTGQCRHMATILQESLEDYGIKSEQIFSTTHTWVRVTLSDPKYAGSIAETFDLDPTWYAQPIPLPPRTDWLLSDYWKKMVRAISNTECLTPTPSTSVTPTPTLTPTPTPTPTISVTPEPTAPEEDTTGSSINGGNPSTNGEDRPDVYWVVPR